MAGKPFKYEYEILLDCGRRLRAKTAVETLCDFVDEARQSELIFVEVDGYAIYIFTNKISIIQEARRD